MAIVTLSHEGLHSFFYKNIVYKSIEAEICENKFKDKPHAEIQKKDTVLYFELPRILMRFIGDFWHKIELPYIYSLANSKIPIRFGMVDDELGSIRFWSLTKRPVKRSEVKFGGNFFHALYHTMFCRLFLISRPVVATGRKNGCAQIYSLQICKC